MYQHLLVPIDGTPLSSATVEQAVGFAKAVGARLTLFHARPDIASTSEGSLLYVMSPHDFAEAAAGNARSLLAKAEASARAGGVRCDSEFVSHNRVHEAILDAAARLGCDLIFMASHGRRGLKSALLGSVARKLMDRTTLPVLLSSVESNQSQLSDEQRALAILREEHRSLAAVLNALLTLVAAPTSQPDFTLLRAMVFYIEQFPERLHHPKEDAHLFKLLRARTPDYNALLDELAQQHREGSACFAAMRATLDAGDLPQFTQQVQHFAKQQWHHLSTEEKLVMPAASQHLLPQDWREIAQAFESNGDPRFGTHESFESLASRLIELAARA